MNKLVMGLESCSILFNVSETHTNLQLTAFLAVYCKTETSNLWQWSFGTPESHTMLCPTLILH